MKAHAVLPVILFKQFPFNCSIHAGMFQQPLDTVILFPFLNLLLDSVPLNCEDFRGIAVSPIISKVFEYCFLNKLGDFLSSKANQFGFKKGLFLQS